MRPLSAFPVLAGFFFFLRAFDTFLILSFSSLFLESFGPAGWPWYFVGFSILFITTQSLLLDRPHLHGEPFLRRALPPLFLTALLLAVFFPTPSGWITFPALVLFRSWDLHATQAFYDLVGKTWALQEARLHLPSLLAAGTLGSVLAGFSLRFLLPSTGFFPLLVLIPFAGCAAWLTLKAYTPDTSTSSSSERPSASPIHWKQISPTHRRYSLAVFLLSIMGSLVVNLVDFQFNANLPDLYAGVTDRAAQVAALLGTLNAVIELTTLALQGLVGRWIFTRLSLGTILSVRPVLLGLLGFIAWAMPQFWTLTGFQFLSRTSTFVFMSPVWVLLLEPLPFSTRSYVRRLLNLVDCITLTSLGLSLALWSNGGSTAHPSLFLLISGFALTTLWFNRSLLSLYPEMIRETLIDLSDSPGMNLDGLKLLSREARRTILRRLFDENGREVQLKVLLRLGPLDLPELHELIHERLPSMTDSTLVASSVRLLLRSSEQVQPLASYLGTCPNPRRLSEIMDAADQTTHPDFEWMFASYFDHQHHRVRGSAVLVYLRHGRGRRLIPQAIETLAGLQQGHAPRDRSTAAVVMGRLGFPAFTPSLFRLVDDPSDDVARCAYHALASIGTPPVLEFVGQRLSQSGIRGTFARTCWNELAGQAQVSLLQSLAAMSDEERHRTGVWIRALRSRLPPTLLQRLLRLKPAERLPAVLESLADSHPCVGELLDACIVEQADGSVVLHEDPLLDHLRRESLLTPVAILPLLLTLTTPEHPLLRGWLQSRLSGFLCDFARLAEAGRRPTIAREKFEKRTTDIHKRWQHFTPLLALLAPRETGSADAFRRLDPRDPRAAALALELTHPYLPEGVHIIVSAIVFADRAPDKLIEAAVDAGFLDPRRLTDPELLPEGESLV